MKILLISLMVIFSSPGTAEIIELSKLFPFRCRGEVRVKVAMNTDHIIAIEHFKGKARIRLTNDIVFCSVEPYETFMEKHYNKKEKRLK